MTEFSNLSEILPEDLKQLVGSLSFGKGKTFPEGIEERINLNLITLLEEVEYHRNKDKDALERISLAVDILKRIKEAF